MLHYWAEETYLKNIKKHTDPNLLNAIYPSIHQGQLFCYLQFVLLFYNFIKKKLFLYN